MSVPFTIRKMYPRPNLETRTGSADVAFPSKAHELPMKMNIKYLRVEKCSKRCQGVWYTPIDVTTTVPTTRREYSTHRPVPVRDQSDISLAKKISSFIPSRSHDVAKQPAGPTYRAGCRGQKLLVMLRAKHFFLWFIANHEDVSFQGIQASKDQNDATLEKHDEKMNIYSYEIVPSYNTTYSTLELEIQQPWRVWSVASYPHRRPAQLHPPRASSSQDSQPLPASASYPPNILSKHRFSSHVLDPSTPPSYSPPSIAASPSPTSPTRSGSASGGGKISRRSAGRWGELTLQLIF